jgi:DNA-binding transcriptional LysR family regulator
MPEVTALGRLGAVSRLLCSSVETQMAAVRAGLGVAVAPAALAHVVPGLAVLPVRVDLGALEVYVLTRASIRRVPRVAVVYEALVRVFGELAELVDPG